MTIRNFFEKWYKVIVSILSFSINTVGLTLTIIQMNISRNAGSDDINSKIVLYTIIGAELFLVISIIYSIISMFRNHSNQIKTDELKLEIKKGKNANRKIYENYKSIITTYKDHNDKIDHIIGSYKEEIKEINDYYAKFIDSVEEEKKAHIDDFRQKLNNKEGERLCNTLIEEYNIFMGNMTNILRSSIEEYLESKGCNDGVSITVKQLTKPVLYKNIKNNDLELYTAFRDFRTYNSRKRTETWERVFHVNKNSDFVSSIEKDYFIFNFMDKKYMEQGSYQNENTTYYEYYNSGVTCSIYSCVNGERKLYGYLACDSLFSEKLKRKLGSDIYDWNVANIMMYSAQIIAMFLEKFLTIWSENNEYYQKGVHESTNPDTGNPSEDEKKEFCNVMKEFVKDKRYNS